MTVPMPLQRGIICSVLTGKNMAFALNEAGEEVLLLGSRQSAWEGNMFRPMPFVCRAMPAEGTLVKMEVETRESGMFRATKWASVDLTEGYLKFFNANKKWGFVVTPMGDTFIHCAGFKCCKDGELINWPSVAREYPTVPGTVIMLRLSKVPRPGKPGPNASEWAVKPPPTK